MPETKRLPIYEIEKSFIEALQREGRVIVQAPTGSGKSTQIPQMLYRGGFLAQGEVVVLQPRRLAARLLARRVAGELEVKTGGLVGYQVRFETHVSSETRIRFVTEGVLLRQMLDDHMLKEVSVLIFDEFHERHLYGDITLGRALQIQQEHRPDLRIVVMSATLEAEKLQSYLAPCQVLQSEGRTYPVEVDYLSRSPERKKNEIWEIAASETIRLLEKHTIGDALVFMPGGYEISRTVELLKARLSGKEFEICPLHGELPPEEQDRAVGQSVRRKVIVSTNVAETSLTIEGVQLVIDSGLVRMARFDPNRGINSLTIEKISHASAEQRRGRAGRTSPGHCLRLWTERDHGFRPEKELPEVFRIDLSEIILALKASGLKEMSVFPWLDAPLDESLQNAEKLLRDLGAVHYQSGEITEVGRRMLAFPLHPRYARMMLAADHYGCVPSIALMIALTQGRGILLRRVDKETERRRDDVLGIDSRSDFIRVLSAWKYAKEARYSVEVCRELGIHAQAARQAGKLADQFLAIAKKRGLSTEVDLVDGDELGKCLLSGFSDQLAKRMDKGTLRCDIVHGRRGNLARSSAVHKSPLFVVAEISEIEGKRGEVSTVLSMCSEVEESWLREFFPGEFKEESIISLDSSGKRVVERKRQLFRDLVLENKESEGVSDDGAAEILAVEIVSGRCKLPAWDESVEQWINRVNCFSTLFPEFEISSIAGEERKFLLTQACLGLRSFKEVKRLDIWPTLSSWLVPEQAAAMEAYLPRHYVLEGGRKVKIRYLEDGVAILSARIQELYDVEGKLSVAAGKLHLKIEILAPNQRPIQLTDDLGSFWQKTYPVIKPALAGRYPKHEWR